MNARRLVRGRWLLPAALVVAAGCTGSGSGQSGNAFVFLSIVRFSLNGTTAVAVVNSSLEDVNGPTLVCVTLRSDPKSPVGPVNPGLDSVVIRQYTVSLTRLDGGAAPGPFTFNTAVTVPGPTVSNGTSTEGTASFPIILVPGQAKREPPLRPLTPLPFTTTAAILFRGRDGRGQGVEVEGALTVVFRDSGTDDPDPCA